MNCAGCSREFQDGDRFIIDTSAGFTRSEPDPVVDDLIAEVFGAEDGKLRLCEDCTEPGGTYQLETFREGSHD
jgi:hypothetical protein